MEYTNKVLGINIVLFVHYPEAFNSSVINNKLNNYFVKYFKEALNLKYDEDCNTVIKTAPHTEKQMITIDVNFKNKIAELINIDKLESEWKEYISNCFNSQIEEIIINIK